MRRFYFDFASAYGTCWLVMLAIAIATSSRVDAGAFGAFGFPVVGLLYAGWSVSRRPEADPTVAHQSDVLGREVSALRRTMDAQEPSIETQQPPVPQAEPAAERRGRWPDRMRILRYYPEVDAFLLTADYQALAEVLDIDGWEAFAWIGRLFCLDNDVGEHWFDNWKLREQRAELAARHGFDVDTLLIIDPRSMADGRDGPCNTEAFRARFWTEVLSSLELSEELIIDKAREFHGRYSPTSEIAALEARVTAWRRDRGQ